MAITLVQQAGHTGGASSVAFGSNNTAGNFIFVIIDDPNGGTIPTPTDTAGDTFHQVIQFTQSGGDNIGFWYAWNCLGGANTVQNTNSYDVFQIYEWSGIKNTADPLITSNSANSSSNTVPSVSETTTVDGCLIIGFLSYYDNGGAPNQTPGSGFSNLSSTQQNYITAG